MSEAADRFQRIAAGFTERVEAVPDGAWDNPAPPEGWTARDVVRHMVEWMPALVMVNWDLEPPEFPSVDEDPAAAWATLVEALGTGLADPEIAAREADIAPGHFTYEVAVDTFCTGDVLVHTWDLARAVGLDETLDPEEVHRAFTGMEPMADMLAASGQYGPRVPVPDDADEQTKLIALTGRQP